jgi:CubicO group peptidase (beta-lactamase class C family)
MVERFGQVPFEATPGEKYQYINLGYYLLSQVISQVTGIPYPAYVERELLLPLGLTQTRYADEHQLIANRAQGYEYYGGQLMNAPYVSSSGIGVGAGGLCSTVGDLVRWTHLLYGGKVVAPASLAQMMAPTVLAGGDTVAYGFGLNLDHLGSHSRIYHGGTRPGFGAFLAHYPADSLTIVVLTNAGSGRAKAEEVEKVLARTALGIREQNLALSAPELARYEGTYRLQARGRTLDLRVFTEGGQLKGQATGQPVAPLRYQGNHEFLVGEGDNIRLAFALEQGRAESITLQQAGRTIPGKRKP